MTYVYYMKGWIVMLKKSENDLLSDDNMHVADSESGHSYVTSCSFFHNTIVTAVIDTIQSLKYQLYHVIS